MRSHFLGKGRTDIFSFKTMIIQVCKLIASEYGRYKVLGSVLMAQTSGASLSLLDEFETKKNPQFCLKISLLVTDRSI